MLLVRAVPLQFLKVWTQRQISHFVSSSCQSSSQKTEKKKIGLKFLQSQFSDNYFTTFTQPLIAFPFIFLHFLCAHSTSLHCFSFKSLESSKCHTCFLFPFQKLITCPFQPSKISQLFQQICAVWLTVVFQSVVLIFIKIIGSNKYTNFTKDVKILKLVKKF